VVANSRRPKSPRAPKVSGRSQVKGVAFKTVLWSLEQMNGAQRVSATLERMNSPAREALRYGEVVPSGWYPVEWYAQLLQAIVDTSHGGADVIRSIAVMAIDRDVSGVYRFLVERLSPATVASLVCKLFPRYYSCGNIRVESAGPKHYRVHIGDCVGFTELIWQEIYAAGKHLMIRSGTKNPRHYVLEGGKDGDSTMLVDARWE
jgi:hypothetical protein